MGAVLKTESLFDRGFAAHCRGDLGAAARAYVQVLRIAPRHLSTLKAYGVLLFSIGETERGIGMLQRATECAPRDAEAWSNYGNALRAVERHAESAEACRRAVELNPKDGTAHSNLAAALRCLGQLGPSLEHASLAVDHAPHLPESHINLAAGLQNLGETESALSVLLRASNVHASHDGLRQNLLFTSLYSDQLTDEQITGMHAAYGESLSRRPRPSMRSQCRNIGFVSGDFRKHPVGRFILSLLPNIDRSRHRVTLYANQHDSDDVSARLAENADRWRPVFGLSDEAAADQIMADEIDVLIDLSGHSAHNRMGVFALGPCAVQATWLGYSSTTGVPAMDWFIGDPVTNPAGTDHLSTERVARLPHAFLCDQPALPGEADPHEGLVFASFNNPAKVSPSCLALWAQVLKAHPGSLLKLKYGTFDDPFVRQVFTERLGELGVTADRLEFCGYQSREDHEAFFRGVDACLDTSPYTGATTTVDAMKAGVPVVTLAGRRYSSRMSASLLCASGLQEFVAESPEEFLVVARRIAENPNGARRRFHALSQSPVFQPTLFAAGLQDLIDSLWQDTP